MADRFLRPGHGHDADRAVELGNVEVDSCLAIRVEADGAGEEGDELFDGRAAFSHKTAAIAARTDAAGCAERTVDQAAIEVAQLDAEPALAEEPAFRVG